MEIISNIIKSLTIAQLLFVILLMALWDFGVARLFYLWLSKAKIAKRGLFTWLICAVCLTGLLVLCYEYVSYRIRNNGQSPNLGWFLIALLPEVLLCNLTRTCEEFHRGLESNQPWYFRIGFVSILMAFDLVLLLPLIQVGMKKKIRP